MSQHSTLTIDSPLGLIALGAIDGVLTSLEIGVSEPRDTPDLQPVLTRAASQLREYFQGVRTTFDLPLSAGGTDFQDEIWQTLLEIPYGVTMSYEQLGEAAGHPGKARAVGGAVGKNPIPIIIPCHRVVGASGALTGYSGGSGVPTKVALLQLEGILPAA
jgi:methylated-DNA-[protein]-cysteine S-methyltransferase